MKRPCPTKKSFTCSGKVKQTPSIQRSRLKKCKDKRLFRPVSSGEVSHLPIAYFWSWREYGIYSVFIHIDLACREQPWSYSWLLMFLHTFSCIINWGVLKIHFGFLLLKKYFGMTYIQMSKDQQILQLRYTKWVKDWEEKILFTHLHHMPFHSFGKYLWEAYCVQGVLLGPEI